MKVNTLTIFFFVMYSLFLLGLGMITVIVGLPNLCNHPELFTTAKVNEAKTWLIGLPILIALMCYGFWSLLNLKYRRIK